jgi:hypothetical protein
VQPLAAKGFFELKRELAASFVFMVVWIFGVLPFGTEEDVIEETYGLRRFAPEGGYLLSTSHNVQADIPPANFMTMIKRRTILAFTLYERIRDRKKSFPIYKLGRTFEPYRYYQSINQED